MRKKTSFEALGRYTAAVDAALADGNEFTATFNKLVEEMNAVAAMPRTVQSVCLAKLVRSADLLREVQELQRRVKSHCMVANQSAAECDKKSFSIGAD